ncbi:hypothetical protein [Ramlibacter sp. AN1133]|uniref:hypothetical protein n=1 Tax=Ramlibacter sp. AN1133 TaxID=3133429 RepID=UPI0030C070FA
MMSNFLASHREELIRRCTAKVAMRPLRAATELQLRNGIPLFLAQLQRTLEAEERHETTVSLMISGPAGGEAAGASEMGTSATAHGRELLVLGYSVSQVVHDYGDLCQAITDLAFEREAPFAVHEFRTLNRCLDNSIASAVEAFSAQRDLSVAAQQQAQASERLEALLHSLRSSLATATYAVAALELGNLSVSGSTGSILKKSLAAMAQRVGGPTLQEIRNASDPTA